MLAQTNHLFENDLLVSIIAHWPCRLLTLLWNFAIVSNYFWILVEGLYLHNIIYFLVFREAHIRRYVIFGWGNSILLRKHIRITFSVTPALITIVWACVKLFADNTEFVMLIEYILFSFKLLDNLL